MRARVPSAAVGVFLRVFRVGPGAAFTGTGVMRQRCLNGSAVNMN